jgi:nucleoside-diphosphate-sugar epimerase
MGESDSRVPGHGRSSGSGSKEATPAGRQTVILGASGVLGEALGNNAVNAAFLPDGRTLLQQLLDGRDESVQAAVAAGADRQDWIYAIGLIDPRARPDQLLCVNADGVELLRRALERAARIGARGQGSIRLVTFGSILEDRQDIVAANAYMRSKARLSDAFELARLSAGSQPQLVAWSHIRLHTLYGGRPQSFMFLGQIEGALRNRRSFDMSAGQQLREYHHASDVAQSVLGYLADAREPFEMIALSSGKPVRLGVLATAVFEHFGLSHLLRIGSIEAAPGEVFEAVATRSVHLTAERDAVQGVIGWLEQLGITRHTV